MATGYMTSTTVTAIGQLYAKASRDMLEQIRVAAIAEGGYEMPAARPTGKLCAYCRREQGAFPTCDGCGASEWVAR